MSSKLVHFSYNGDIEMYRAEFYVGGACVDWKYLTNDEWVGLCIGEAVDFTDLPQTYFPEPLLDDAETCSFDDEENSFMLMLRKITF